MHSTVSGKEEYSFWRELVKGCDAFPKVDVTYLNLTTSGGLTSIVAYTLITLLTVFELWRYLFVPTVNYSLRVDPELQSDIKLHFDISIATPCNQLVFAVVDAGGQKEFVNHLVKAEEIQWRQSSSSPVVEGCRVKSSLPLNKVGGSLLILPNAIQLPGPFGHILIFVDKRVNFSHRIHRFAFGPSGENLGRDFKERYFKNPLDGAQVPSLDSHLRFTYDLSVVPTKYINSYSRVQLSTNQYSVKGFKSRRDDPSVILPGLYFMYDLEPLAVSIRSDYKSFIWFIVDVLGIIGGIYTCSGLIHHAVHHFYIYYVSSKNAMRSYLGALDGRLPSGSISYTPIRTNEDHFDGKPNNQ